ncbi:DUF3048 family protein [Alkalibaculum bacchi]|uniref:DUF3048 family protein n=1 Tax=Alkalibaculum bacchi TaxID=645887 RepID=A0A366IGQ8_9FIRM|nr:DUF3048 domain-containing protein [Alkalibaculum bacchi]RBP69100.1 DUF3048 family protein [Alkalibaculum bacchi]
MKKIYIVLTLVLLFITSSCSKTPTSSDPLPDPEPSVKEPITSAPARYEDVPEGISPLTGLPYDGDGRGIMVQLENTPEARPHSGITQADLIYEMEVESKITRLTSFFLSEYPEKVGPVRSARRQHMYLWKEWDYLYAFYGGSELDPGQNIYTLISELNITQPALNGHKNSTPFTRAKDRKAPHNAYINLNDTIKNKYNYNPVQRSICFDKMAEITGDVANEITFSYNSSNNIKYIYNNDTSEYERFINGEPMMDKENNEQLSVKNIVIQHADHYKVDETVYTNIDLVGSGKSQYFTEGTMRTGTWKREGVNSLTRYYDENGEEIAFKPGMSYIQIVRNDTSIEFK